MKEIKDNWMIIALVVGILVCGLVSIFLLTSKKPLKNIEVPATANPTMMKENPTPTPTPIPGDTVMMVAYGFNPPVLQVKKGSHANFINFISNDINVVFDTAPTGVNLTSLKVGTLKENDTSDPIDFFIPGTYSYHNQLNPSQKGVIVVK